MTSIIVAATVALGFGGYVEELTNIPVLVSALGILGILSIVNFIGIKESAWANTIFAIVTISGLGIIIFIGFVFPVDHDINYFENILNISLRNLIFTKYRNLQNCGKLLKSYSHKKTLWYFLFF